MAGFVAVVAVDHTTVEQSEALALVRDYESIRGVGAVQTRQAGDWGRIATIEHNVPVVTDHEDASWAVAIGSPYAEKGLCSAPLVELDGQFAGIRYFHARDELEMVTDPFGMQDIYFALRSGRLYVSTSALVLARHLSADRDLLGMQLFLRTGVQFGPVTHWHGIERLEPATALIVEAGGRSRQERYWAPAIDEDVRRLSLPATIDRCIEAGVSIIERRLGSGGLVSADITGGFDSRLVTSLLQRARVPFETLTVAEEPVDAKFARAVAESAGWPFRAQEMPQGWQLTSDRLQKALGWGDGRLNVFDLAEVLWRQEDRSSTSRRVVTGGGGENFGPSPWMQELWRAGRTRDVNYDNLMNMRVFLPLDVSALSKNPRDDAEPYVREVLQRRAEPYRGHLNVTQLDVIHAYREVGHFGAYRSAGEAEVRAQLPFYFRDFWGLAVSANHRWRNGHRLHRGMIEQLNPEVAAIGTQRGGPAELLRAGNAVRFLPYYARLGRTAIRKVRGRRTMTARADASGVRAQRDAIRGLRGVGVLDPRQMETGDLYDGPRLRQMVDAGEAGTVQDWALLGRIATLELAARATTRDPSPLKT